MKVKKFLIYFFFVLSIIFVCLGILTCFKLPSFINTNIHTSARFAIPLAFFVSAVFSLIMGLYAVFSFTCQYPLNNTQDYLLNVRIPLYGKIENNNLIIDATKTEKGKYQIKEKDKVLLFDLAGYIFPKAYLKAYFIRNYNYIQINSDKLSLRNVYLGVKLTYLKKYDNVWLNVDGRKLGVIKNGKTTPSILSTIINYSPFWHVFLGRGEWRHSLNYYENIDEKIYKQKCARK